ncbi:alpha/beta hydrolase family protein [Sphingomonas sp. NCPPB 2930]
MKTHILSAIAIASTAVLLTACGGGGDGGTTELRATDTGTTRGTLVDAPVQTASLTATTLEDGLPPESDLQQQRALAGKSRCGVDVHTIKYVTVGGARESTHATGAVMVPTGSDPSCRGARPIVLYAHGTSTDKAYNIANVRHPDLPGGDEGQEIAALYAAQGFIVVAPNYAGYGSSTLGYHPFLNAEQQSADMIDALAAGRNALRTLQGVSDSGKLLITGYSEGGYVALATQRALQNAGQPVTAVAALSAPSAISLILDYGTLGAPNLGSTVFLPLITTSWQKQFGSLYHSTGEVYEAEYARGIETLLPSTKSLSQIFQEGKLPPLALYPANAQPGPASSDFAPFYADHNLLKQSFLTANASDIQGNPCPGNAFPPTEASRSSGSPLACGPTSGLRRAAVANDLRTYLPNRPTLLCGGAEDPTVNFESTRATAGYFKTRGMSADALQMLDLEAPVDGASDPYAAAKTGFRKAKAARKRNHGDAAVTRDYHDTLVPPFCNAVARGFFQQVLAQGG